MDRYKLVRDYGRHKAGDTHTIFEWRHLNIDVFNHNGFPGDPMKWTPKADLLKKEFVSPISPDLLFKVAFWSGALVVIMWIFFAISR